MCCFLFHFISFIAQSVETIVGLIKDLVLRIGRNFGEVKQIIKLTSAFCSLNIWQCNFEQKFQRNNQNAPGKPLQRTAASDWAAKKPERRKACTFLLNNSYTAHVHFDGYFALMRQLPTQLYGRKKTTTKTVDRRVVRFIGSPCKNQCNYDLFGWREYEALVCEIVATLCKCWRTEWEDCTLNLSLITTNGKCICQNRIGRFETFICFFFANCILFDCKQKSAHDSFGFINSSHFPTSKRNTSCAH